MTTVGIRNEITAVQQVLMDILQLAFWRRLPPMADLAALRSRAILAVSSGRLIYVTAEVRLYRWVEYSTAADDGLNVIMPSTLPAGQTKGRWHRVSSQVTYGPDGNAPLQSKELGVCAGVMLYAGEETYVEFVEHVYGHEPAMYLEWLGDEPEGKSAGFRGSLYRNEHSFTLFIGSQCLFPMPAAVWGSPLGTAPGEDPGINALIGEARYVMAGVETYVTGVEFVEIGAARKVHEELDQRVFVYAFSLTVRVSYSNDDQDLIPLQLEVQPKWAGDAVDAEGFDAQNYIQSGMQLDSGPGGGLTQIVLAGAAVIDGAAVSSIDVAHTFAMSVDTYRDLNPDGTITFSEVPPDDPAPPLSAGSLRLAMTRTDASNVIADFWLAAFSIDLGEPYTLP